MMGLSLAACSRDGLAIGAPPPDDDGGARDLATTLDAEGDLAPYDLAFVCPAATPSTQTVNVTVTNASGTLAWLITRGQYCDPFSISGAALSEGYSCVCECPPPPPPSASYYTRIPVGGTMTMSWDARALADCTESVDCAQRGWPGAGIQQVPSGNWQPAAPGSYTITLAYELEAPQRQSCNMLANGDVSCIPNAPMAGSPAGPTAQLCPSKSTAAATFTLPASGDVAVAIALE